MAGTATLDRTFSSIYDDLEGRWVGCNWTTDFGPGHLNLCGVTARQAALLTRATCGQESDHWREAARWLAKVEADAEAARRSAWKAWQEAAAGRFSIALDHARRACELEQAYHPEAAWKPLEDAIRMSCGDDAGNKAVATFSRGAWTTPDRSGQSSATP